MKSLSSTAGHATDQLKDTFVDLSAQAMKLFSNLRDAEERGMETVLERLGLQRRQSALTPALWFAGGAIVAGAAVLLLHPTSGKKLRQRIATILDGEVQELTSQAAALEQRLEETLKSDASMAKKTPNGATHDVGR
jgi:gas vesicle protein